jgi:dephospho-CoA kinase
LEDAVITIGLTGGIATGKSTASEYLKQLGASVWDADLAAREVVLPGRPGWQALREAFGPEYFDAQGSLNRVKLADRIFQDPEARSVLNSLLHPAILQDMREFLNQCRASGVAIAVVDVPLLLESGADRDCDVVWALSCGVDEQMNRLMARGLSYEDAQKRIEAQMSDRERRRRARRVIDTLGSVEDTRRQLKALYLEALDGEL